MSYSSINNPQPNHYVQGGLSSPTLPSGLPQMGRPMTTRQLMGNHYTSNTVDMLYRLAYGTANAPHIMSYRNDNQSNYYSNSYSSYADSPCPSRRSPSHSPRRRHGGDPRKSPPQPASLQWTPPPAPAPPPPRPNLNLRPPSHPSHQRQDSPPMEDSPSTTTTTTTTTSNQELDEFEKAEMTKVIAKQISGSKIHDALLQKLRENGLNGMTFSRINWAFPDLSREVDHYCKMYQIPLCISVLDVLKELDQVQFQYDVDESLRLYIAQDGEEDPGTRPETEERHAQQEEEDQFSTGTPPEREEMHAEQEGDEKRDTNAEDSQSITFVVDDSPMRENAQRKDASTNKTSQDQECAAQGDDMDISDSDVDTPSTAIKNYPPAPHVEKESSDEEYVCAPAKNQDRSSSKVDKQKKDNGKTKDSARGEVDELAKSLRAIVKKKEGFATLQFALLLQRDRKTGPWPTSRLEMKSYVLELLGRRTNLPLHLKQWFEEQLEGYPASHRQERANYIAGRLMATFQRYKVMLKSQHVNNGKKQVGGWDKDRMRALTDLFIRENGPQLPPEEKEEEPVTFDEEEEVDENIEMLELEPVKQEVEADGDEMNLQSDQDLASSVKSTPSIEKNQQFSHATPTSREEIETAPKRVTTEIAKFLETMEKPADGFASMDFLVMLKKNYDGKTWPPTRNDLRKCVQSLVSTIHRPPPNQHCGIPVMLRQHIQEQLGKFDTNVVVARVLRGFLRHFQDAKCVKIKEEMDPKVSRLLWNMERVDAIRDHLLEHPLENRKQPARRELVADVASEAIKPPKAKYRKAKEAAGRLSSGCEVIEIKDSDEEEDPPTWKSLPRVDATSSSRNSQRQPEVKNGALSSSKGPKLFEAASARFPKSTTDPSPNSRKEPELTRKKDPPRAASSTSCKSLEQNEMPGAACSQDAPSPKSNEGAAGSPPLNSSKSPRPANEPESNQAVFSSPSTSPKPRSTVSQQPNEGASSEGANSLATLAALDVLFVLDKHYGANKNWPSKPKSISNALKTYLTSNKRQMEIPTHLFELRKRIVSAKGLTFELEKQVLTELERLGACSSGIGKSVMWIPSRVDPLLQQHKPLLRQLAEGQSWNQPTGKRKREACTSPRAKKQKECAPSTSNSNAPPVPKSPEESYTVPSSKRLKTGELRDQTTSVVNSSQLPQGHLLNAAQTKSVPADTKATKHIGGSLSPLGFDAARGYAIVRVKNVHDRCPSGILFPSPPLISNDVQVLLDLLPQDLAVHLSNVEVQLQLSEIVLDKGRPLVAWSSAGRINLATASRSITNSDIAAVVNKIGGFGSDNRAGLDEQLHRVAAVRNRQQEIVGLTFQVRRRYVSGGAGMITDILYKDPSKSILFLGEPGTGKTTLMREVACCLAEKSKVVIVDTTSEIGGDGDIPHPAIGLARRIFVPSMKEQANVIAQCAQNHTPEVMVIDKIGLPEEVEVIRTCKDQNIRLIGSAQGSLRRFVHNPRLQGLMSASSGTPVFDIIVELQGPHEWNMIPNAANVVEGIGKGDTYHVQCRTRDPVSGNFQFKTVKL